MQQKELGAFYTPKHTVQYMLSQISRIVKIDSDSVILEPSGWDGIFVSCLLDDYPRVQAKHIDVRDINPEVKDQITQCGVHFSNKDSLLDSTIADWSTCAKWRYSHIIWNPPYLNKQSGYIKKNKKLLKNIYDEIGVHDTYAMFMYLWCKLLKPWGVLWFIVSDTFLTLWIHKKLRKFLLEDVTIKEITICPKKLFAWVTVATCIIIVQNKKPDKASEFVINDCRKSAIGDYDGISSTFNQNKTYNNPDHVFNFNGDTDLIQHINHDDKIIDYITGWLWMHTKDNNKYLAIIDYNGTQYAKRKSINLRVDKNEVDWKKRRFYHKQWGDYKYSLPSEYAVKWDDASVSNYSIPRNVSTTNNAQWFIVSGVCSTLSARLSTIWAMWESNKAMCFFPKDPQEYPCAYFLWLLNSSVYAKFIKFLNHTNSLQIRDIYKLPMLHTSESDKKIIIDIVTNIIKKQKKDIKYDFSHEQKEIDHIVEKYFIADQ